MEERSSAARKRRDPVAPEGVGSRSTSRDGSAGGFSLPRLVVLLAPVLLVPVLGGLRLDRVAVDREAGDAEVARGQLFAGGEENGNTLVDSDQDLLPDEAEWVLLGDPSSPDTDGDGVDDFIEAIEHQSLVQSGNPQLAPTDSMRVVVHTSPGSMPGEREFWVHLLYRLPSGNELDLEATILLFRTDDGRELDLTPLLFTPLVRETKTRMDPTHGLLKRISLRLPEAPGFSTLTPCSFRAYSLVCRQIIGSGMPLFFVNGAYHVLTHMRTDQAVMQSAGQNELSNPFWSAQKVCVLKVEAQAYGPFGILCEITDANCETAQTPSCTSACRDSIGILFTFPDALSLILGG